MGGIKKGKIQHRSKFLPSSKVHERIWDRDKGICVYCGKEATDIDHIIPAAMGGRAIYSNGVLSCRSCNLAKTSDPFNEKYLLKAYRHLLLCGVSIDTEVGFQI